MKHYFKPPLRQLAKIVMLASMLMLSAGAPAWGEPTLRIPGRQEAQGMPDFTIRFRPDGSVVLAKIPLPSSLPGMDKVGLEPEMVARFTNGNIQHIHLDYHDTGIVVLVNGIPMLDFHYKSDDELRAMLTALTIFMGNQGLKFSNLAKTLLPVLKWFGSEVTFEFPQPAGKPRIPRADKDDYLILDLSDIAHGDARAKVTGIETFNVQVVTTGQLTSSDFIFNVLRAAIPPNVEMKLPLTTIADIREKGITEITIKNRRYGLAIELNGQPSPSLIFDLDNLLAFAEHQDRWRHVAPSVSTERFELVHRMVRDVLQHHNVDFTLHFPPSAASRTSKITPEATPTPPTSVVPRIPAAAKDTVIPKVKPSNQELSCLYRPLPGITGDIDIFDEIPRSWRDKILHDREIDEPKSETDRFVLLDTTPNFSDDEYWLYVQHFKVSSPTAMLAYGWVRASNLQALTTECTLENLLKLKHSYTGMGQQ